MRFTRRMSYLRNQRGQIILFVMLAVVFLLGVGGSITSDMAKLVAAKEELQSSLDAAALAGAGKLGFDSSAFPVARNFAVNYASSNKTRTGTIALNRNDANDWSAFNAHAMPYGDVTLGIWDPGKPDGIGAGKRFEPSLDGTVVNAVMCRYKKQVAGNFLSLLGGLFPMNIGASAIATANPPTLPPTPCVFPIALSSCPFTNNDVFSSNGCGVSIKFITSSGKSDDTNTAAWVNLSGTGNPQPKDLIDQIQSAGKDACPQNAPQVGSLATTQGGMVANVFDALRDTFKAEYNASVSSGTKVTIKDSQGRTTYNGYGWKVWVPVVETDCNADGTTKQIQGDRKITGWTEFVMTQAWDSTGSNKSPVGLGCVVSNDADGATWPYCTQKDPKKLPAGLQGGKSRSVFGVYSCSLSPTPPVPVPVPRSALATKLRLVR